MISLERAQKKDRKGGNKSPKSIIVWIATFVLIALALWRGIDMYIDNADAPLPIEGGDAAVDVESEGLAAHFIDVGQGDCSLITADGGVVLIDSGTPDSREKVVGYLRDRGVSNIDCVVATHPHSDHIGGMKTVFRNFNVRHVMIPAIAEDNLPNSSLFDSFVNAINDEEGCTAEYAVPGETKTFGGITFTVLGPINQYEAYNDMSIVLRVEYDGKSILYMGDAELEEVADILDSGRDVRADVIKCGHHGSSDSTTAELLDKVKPDIAIISCAADNPYGHPHRETVDELDKRNVRSFRTDRDGDIIITIKDGKTGYLTGGKAQ